MCAEVPNSLAPRSLEGPGNRNARCGNVRKGHEVEYSLLVVVHLVEKV
jgi:hypothetical protein